MSTAMFLSDYHFSANTATLLKIKKNETQVFRRNHVFISLPCRRYGEGHHFNTTCGSDYKVSEKTAYKVQVSTFWADCKVQVFVNFWQFGLPIRYKLLLVRHKLLLARFFFVKFWVPERSCTFWVAYKVQVLERSLKIRQNRLPITYGRFQTF